MKNYPDISDIIARKERHRRLLAALPFEEKVELAFRLAERAKFIRSGRTEPTPPDDDTAARPAEDDEV